MKATEQYFRYFIMMYQVVRDDGNKLSFSGPALRTRWKTLVSDLYSARR